ncbi:hypothetical protein [Mesorhizobium sp. NZP2077]|uniref:hypothetical protein n=1 Tax=Mesorhizobium sp. NZP2077 TaxID=2483404 RepID=UPI0015567169|nr:hypothetical protein [Mesorhizobium sp. NZP2077]QKC83585.1 hypothetical protein EB232_20050 [Mesorhizobium sp. NZP2077]QKD17106.1 hypothetical protein HGP13_19785 [Mesorhizobium sp. NZP2077]
MRDLALQIAGALAIFVAVVHGAMAELQVFPKVHIESRRSQRLLRMVWQASTIDWICIGALLIVAPTLGSESARRWIIAAAVVAYGYAAIGNAVASRGRHVGCYLMGLVVGLSLMGL